MSVLVMTRSMPEIIEVTPQQLEELLARVESNTLREEDAQLLRQILDSYVHFFEIVGDKNTTIARLRKLLFGVKTEKAKTLQGQQPEPEASPGSGDPDAEPGAAADTPIPRNHGRRGADEYPGAQQVDIPHPTLCAGDACPACLHGTVYEKNPSVIVRFVGQAPLQATVYRLQRLRCSLCGKVFTAPAPQDAKVRKYDHTVVSMIGLLKYGSGLPFNRLQGLQRNCEIPLAASTQWEIVDAGASLLAAAYEEHLRQAAQGDVVHNDDTTVKILELMGKRAQKSPPTDDPHDPNRTGLFTSGVVSLALAGALRSSSVDGNTRVKT